MRDTGNNLVIFQWINNPKNARLSEVQHRLESAIRSFGLLPLRYEAGRRLTPFGDLLKSARSRCMCEAFVWCNSDVILTRNPFQVPHHSSVYGFHRREVPSGEICSGVDMYYIPVKWWDEYLSKDVPKLYLGASYVDWWISRAMQKVGSYENLSGYIDHVTHRKTEAAASDTNTYYQTNFRAYNSWARRNGLALIPAPPHLIPGLGHVWGLRDAIKKTWSNALRNKGKQNAR